MLEKAKNMTFAENVATIKGALSAESEKALEALADELCS